MLKLSQSSKQKEVENFIEKLFRILRAKDDKDKIIHSGERAQVLQNRLLYKQPPSHE